MANKTLSLDGKQSALSAMLKRVNNVELDYLMGRIRTLDLKSRKEIEMLVVKCFELAIDNHESSATYAGLLKSFHESLTTENKQNFDKSFQKLIKKNLETFSLLSSENLAWEIFGGVFHTALLFGNLYNVNLVEEKSILLMVMEFKRSQNELLIRKMILETIKEKITAQIDDGTNNSEVKSLYGILNNEGMKVDKKFNPKNFSETTDVIVKLLKKINCNNVAELVNNFNALNLTAKNEELKMFAEKLAVEATLENTKFVASYAELTKKYSDTISLKSRNFLTAQVHIFTVDIIILTNSQPLFADSNLQSKDTIKGISVFIGHLYNVGFFDEQRMVEYLLKFKTIENDRGSRKIILQTIGDRVIEKFGFSNDKSTCELHDMLFNEGFICDKSTKEKAKASTTTAGKSSDFGGEFAKNMKGIFNQKPKQMISVKNCGNQQASSNNAKHLDNSSKTEKQNKSSTQLSPSCHTQSNEDKIDKFVEHNVKNAIESGCPEIYVETCRIYYEKLSVEGKEIFRKRLLKSIDEAVKVLAEKHLKKDPTFEKQAESVGVFFGQLHNNNLEKFFIVDTYLLIEHDCRCWQSVRKWILRTIKDEIRKIVDESGHFDLRTYKILLILMKENYIEQSVYSKYYFSVYQSMGSDASSEDSCIVMKHLKEVDPKISEQLKRDLIDEVEKSVMEELKKSSASGNVARKSTASGNVAGKSTASGNVAENASAFGNSMKTSSKPAQKANKQPEVLKNSKKIDALITLLSQLNLENYDKILKKILALNIKGDDEVKTLMIQCVQNGINSRPHIVFIDIMSKFWVKSTEKIVCDSIKSEIDNLRTLSDGNARPQVIKDLGMRIGSLIASLFNNELICAQSVYEFVSTQKNFKHKRYLRMSILASIKHKILAKITVQQSNDDGVLKLGDLIVPEMDNIESFFEFYNYDDSDDEDSEFEDEMSDEEDSEFENEMSDEDSQKNDDENSTDSESSNYSEHHENSSTSVPATEKIGDFGASFAKNLKGFFNKPSSSHHVQLKSLKCDNESLKDSSREQTPEEKLIALESALRKISTGDVETLAKRLSPQNYTTQEEVRQFLEKTYDAGVLHYKSSRKYVEFAQIFRSLLSSEMQKVFTETSYTLLNTNQNPLMILHNKGYSKEMISKTAKATGILIGNFYNCDMIEPSVMHSWFYNSENEINYYRNLVFYWLHVTIRDKLKHWISRSSTEAVNVFQISQFLKVKKKSKAQMPVAAIKKKKKRKNKTSAKASNENPQMTENPPLINENGSTIEPSASTPTEVVKPSMLVKEFVDFLETFNPNSKKFKLSKFNGSNEEERKHCIDALINFVIQHPEHAEKLIKFTQNLVHYEIQTSDNCVINDIPNLIAKFCDEKLKIFTNDDKNWTEIDGFGMFLAHMFGIKLLETRFFYAWLDEVKKYADVNDDALKMFISVFKFASNEMKKTNLQQFTMYLSELQELKNKNPRRIANNNKKWITKELGVKKQVKKVVSEAAESQAVMSTAANAEKTTTTQNQSSSAIRNENSFASTSSSVNTKNSNEKSLNSRSVPITQRDKQELVEKQKLTVSFEDLIKNIPNIAENSPRWAEMKLKICQDDKSMKEFVKVFWNCCVEDSKLAVNVMKFGKSLSEYPKFKEIHSTFIKMLSLLSRYNNLIAIKFVINLYKNSLVDIEALKSWLTMRVLAKFEYSEILELNELINDLNCDDLREQASSLDNLMHENFMKLCSSIKNDLKEFIKD